jgi:uncharacterized protein (DUF111 family)
LRRPPRLDPPTVVPLTTVVDRVRSAREVGQRLARVAHGAPTVPPPAGRPLATCSVSSSGVRWS